MPCLPTFCKLLSLRHVLRALEDIECPSRTLLLYFLGPSRRTLVPRGLGNMCPSAETVPPHYRTLLDTYRLAQQVCPQFDLKATPVSRVCEALCASRVGTLPAVQNLQATWLELTSADLPPLVQDFVWRAGHGVLPTRDRLARWGITRNVSCPNCNRPESNRHAVADCVQVKTFLTVVSRSIGVRLDAAARRRCLFTKLVFAAALFVVWRSRCIAIARRRPFRIMFPLLARLRKILYNHLEASLYVLGEHEFLRKWGTRFISVRQGSYVQLPLRML